MTLRHGPPRAWLGNLAAGALLAAAALALLPLHDDGWSVSTRARDVWLAAGLALAYAGVCGWIGWRAHAHGVRARADTATSTTLIAWASQTGFAHALALRTSTLLQDAGVAHAVVPLHRVDAAALARCTRLLVVASTTGEGDPPDHALAFLPTDTMQRPDLSHLGYAVLALGDREYARYCGFGHQLDHWLHACGAHALFDLTEVDNGDPAALRHWQHQVAQLCGATAQADWVPPQYQPWTLHARTPANPGAAGHEAFHISLQAPASSDPPQWQAGDIIEIGPRNAPAAVSALLATLGLACDTEVQADGERTLLGTLLARSRLPEAAAVAGLSAHALARTLAPLPHREYSIASLPAEGPLQLLVRRMRHADGRPGLGSGWLCDHAAPGDTIDARIRSNVNFHAPDTARPMILVGNGTGIAGLRAHLAARIAAGRHRNWLLLGERRAGRDDFFGAELEQWLRDGKLQRLDRVYSRDGHRERYVQDALAANIATLRTWVDDGAAILVCGSLRGMAPAVDAVLRDALGSAAVDGLLADGRYRRDVY